MFASSVMTFKFLVLILLSFSSSDARNIKSPCIHMDEKIFPKGCGTCHKGHGVPDTPMLPLKDINALCFKCHGDKITLLNSEKEGLVVLNETKDLKNIRLEFEKRFSHRKVKCTACHHQHRMKRKVDTEFSRYRKISPYDGKEYEYELCFRCHSSSSMSTHGVTKDIKSKFENIFGSSHPLLRENNAEMEFFTSLKDEWKSRKYIECSDCHGSDDLTASEGVHGSTNPFILKFEYELRSGNPEGERTYRLCYNCHEREKVLSPQSFPYHINHVVIGKISCYECHDAHGSSEPHLLKLGKANPNITPSSSGKIEFIKKGGRHGRCFLKCHGFDHNPKEY